GAAGPSARNRRRSGSAGRCRAVALFRRARREILRRLLRRVLRPAMECVSPSCAREETPESRGVPCLFLNTERGFGGKPPKKSGFRRHLAGQKCLKRRFLRRSPVGEWSRGALDASGFGQG